MCEYAWSADLRSPVVNARAPLVRSAGQVPRSWSLARAAGRKVAYLRDARIDSKRSQRSSKKAPAFLGCLPEKTSAGEKTARSRGEMLEFAPPRRAAFHPLMDAGDLVEQDRDRVLPHPIVGGRGPA